MKFKRIEKRAKPQRMCDLEPGQCFIRKLDSKEVFMIIKDDNCTNHVIELESGDMWDIGDDIVFSVETTLEFVVETE